MKQYNSMYLGLCVNNQDPERRGRVQVFVPHIMPALYDNWNASGEDIQINCVGDNIEGALSSNIIEKLVQILPWAEAASPIIGTSAPGNLVSGGRGLGQAIGGAIGGAVAGAPGQAIGQAVGGAIGSVFDQGPTTTEPTAVSQPPNISGPLKFKPVSVPGGESNMPGGTNGNWAGSIYKVSSYLPRNFNLSSTKRSGCRILNGNTGSDHNCSNANSYGVDISLNSDFGGLSESAAKSQLSAPTQTAIQIANTIRAEIGKPPISSWPPSGGGLYSETTPDGYRVQVIWQASGHYDHIHVGAKFIGQNPPQIAASAAPNPVAPQTQSDGNLNANNSSSSGAAPAPTPGIGDVTTESAKNATTGLGGGFIAGGPGTGTPAGTVSGKGTVSGGGTQVRNYDFKGKQNEAFAAIKAAAEKAGSPDPSLTASIASLEGGWLTSSMSRRANNPFGQTITPAQIGTNGIIGGTKGRDGQLHAVYDNLESAMAHHVKKWGKHYVAGDVNASTRNLVGASYNIEQGGGPWASSVQGIYAKRSGIPGVQVTGLEGMPPDASIANSSSATPPAVVEKTYGHGPVTSKNTNDMPAGLFAYPSPGAMLWVFFREGNPLYPVYFAASYGQSEWSAAYRQGSPAPRMAFNGEGSNGGFSHGTVMNPVKGGPSLEFGTDYDGVDPSSDNSSFGVFNQNKSNLMIDNRLYQLYANSDRLDYTQDDSFETVMGYKESWVQGNSNQVVMGNQTIKIGNFSQQAIDAMQQLSDFSQQLNQTLMTNGGGGSPSIQSTTNDTGLNSDATLPANLQKTIDDQSILNKLAPQPGEFDYQSTAGNQVPGYLQAGASQSTIDQFRSDSRARNQTNYTGSGNITQQGTMTTPLKGPSTFSVAPGQLRSSSSPTNLGVMGSFSSAPATNQTPPTINTGDAKKAPIGSQARVDQANRENEAARNRRKVENTGIVARPSGS